MKQSSQTGFTLLEMMVAIVLFAIIGITGFQILQGVLRNGQISQQHATRLAEAQQAFNLLEQDIAQAVVQPFEGDGKNPIPAASNLSGEHPELKLLRRNWLNPAGYLPRSSLEHVSWRLNENGLVRMSGETVPEIRARFDSINGFRLRFWLNGHWLDAWFASYVLPEALEVTLDVEGFGALQRVIFITGTT